jgi:hypothetical protein
MPVKADCEIIHNPLAPTTKNTYIVESGDKKRMNLRLMNLVFSMINMPPEAMRQE